MEYLERGYGFGLRCHCTSLVPCPSFYGCFSFNSDIDERMSFKSEALSEDDVLLIAHELGPSWKMVGLVLKVPDAVIDEIEANKSEDPQKCYSKCDCLVIVA